MDQTIEQVANHLVNMLNQQMSEYEDAETAIATYKTANWVISQLDDVKRSAVTLAQQDMLLHGKANLKTSAGSSGWTQPKARQLNERAWREALAQNPDLLRLQREYDQAQARLQQAQEQYMETPEPSFFIR